MGVQEVFQPELKLVKPDAVVVALVFQLPNLQGGFLVLLLVVLHPLLYGLVELSLDRTASPVLGGLGFILYLILGVLAEGGA